MIAGRSLLALAAAFLAAGWAQITIGLRPLAHVGERVAALGSGEATRLGADFPAEVRPLAAEIDAARDPARGLASAIRVHLLRAAREGRLPVA